MELNSVSERTIGAAIQVHRTLGPGLLESAYQACLAYELGNVGLRFEQQVGLPVHYGTVVVECGYRMDFVVEGLVVVELKAVETVLPIHEAQLLTYLRLSNLPLGLLLNFNTILLKDGIHRRRNGM